jgi:hypothetical protein
MAGFGGRGLVVVVEAVETGDGGAHQLVDVEVVEAVDANGVEFAAERGVLAPGEGADSTVFAKEVVVGVGMILDEGVLAGEQAEIAGLHDGAPHPRLDAEFAIAFEGAGGEVEVGFEADCAAVAATVVCAFHLSLI